MRGLLKSLALVAGLAALPSLASAQGTITGTIRDASGGVLPGVTVEAASPALIEKVRTVVSDGTGQYRIVDLSPGAYTVTATLPGFATVRREGITIAGAATVAIPIEMRVGGLQETITVTGETPVVDVQTVRRETVLDANVIASIPATRTVGSLLNATPGLTVASGGLQPTPTMTFFSARGGQTNEGRMTVNGMTVAAAFNGGGVSSYILDSVNVDAGSLPRTAGRRSTCGSRRSCGSARRGPTSASTSATCSTPTMRPTSRTPTSSARRTAAAGRTRPRSTRRGSCA